MFLFLNSHGPLIRGGRLALAGLALLAGGLAAEEVKWTSAQEFAIEGKGWEKTPGPFARLPDTAQAKVSEVAWRLSGESAGLCVRFVTDASEVSLRWSLTDASLAMPHMPATGCSGLDLYARAADGSWKFQGNARPFTTEGNVARIELAGSAAGDRECLVYLPAYNGTKSLEIGVPPANRVLPPPPRAEALRQPVAVYGTSIVQGGCASRPGMLWTAILGRMLDRPVVNLGFSSAGTMLPPVGEVLAELDPAAYIMDCTWNMGDSEAVYLDRITQLVRAIRQARPQTPIVFVGQSHHRAEKHPTDLTRRQEAAVRHLQKEGVSGLTLVPGEDLIGSDGEGTVDGVHLNDLGMDRQAKALFPIIQRLLASAAKDAKKDDGPE